MTSRLPKCLDELCGLYNLFARLFSHPPDAEVVEDVKSLGWVENDPKLEALQVDFTRLFSAPTPEAIPTHQSVYTDILTVEASGTDPTGCGLAFAGGSFHGCLGGESCSDAGRFYRHAGFIPPDSAPAMADHISSEFTFMGYLCLMERRSLENGLEKEAKVFGELRAIFQTQFLGRWIEQFADKVAANPVSVFYREVGRELRACNKMMFVTKKRILERGEEDEQEAHLR